jgi:hypothetical protein
MHSAPAVIYPVGRSSFQGAFIALVFLVSSISCGLWIAQGNPAVWMRAMSILALSMSGSLAFIVWWRTPSGQLRWSGQSWTWIGAQAEFKGTVILQVDIQFCMVLCLHFDDGKNIWMVPERGGNERLWGDLRRAVFSQASGASSHSSPRGTSKAGTHIT